MNIKSCLFIEIETGRGGNKTKKIYVQRPSGWIMGWARSIWLKRHFKQKCLIASPDYWEILLKHRAPAKILIEENGIYRIESIK